MLFFMPSIFFTPQSRSWVPQDLLDELSSTASSAPAEPVSVLPISVCVAVPPSAAVSPALSLTDSSTISSGTSVVCVAT